MKTILCFFLFIAGIWSAAAAPVVKTQELLRFHVSLDRKTKDATLHVRNISQEPLQLSLLSLRSPNLALSYKVLGETRRSNGQITPVGEPEQITLEPGASREVIVNIAPFFATLREHFQKEKTLEAAEALELTFLFTNLIDDGRLTREARIHEGPTLRLGDADTLWKKKKK